MDELRRLRQGRGWTQAKLAVESGVDPSTVNQIETGARRPTTRTLDKLATALEVEVADLFPKDQAPLFTERLEQASSEQRREHRDLMADAFARLIDLWEEDLVRQEDLISGAHAGERRDSKLAFSRWISSGVLARNCRRAAEVIEETYAEAETDSSPLRAMMDRLEVLAERADTFSRGAHRNWWKLEAVEDEKLKEELRKESKEEEKAWRELSETQEHRADSA